jgi:hypothetical protein
MQASSIPYKFATPWGADATTEFITLVIPATASGAVASQQLGFPPATATPVAAGGTPPSIADFNGLGFFVTSWLQWVQAGGPIVFDATFASAIGGYPKGAILADATTPGVEWVSTADNNTTNPNGGGGSNWSLLGAREHNIAVYTNVGGTQFVSVNGATPTTTGATSFTAPVGVTDVKVRVWGGGGAGGGTTNVSAAGGGGGGGYGEGIVTVAHGAAEAVTVGAGGIASGTSNGPAGGTSSFGSSITCTGGGGGLAQNTGGESGGGSGGTGSGGALNFGGLGGGSGTIFSSTITIGGLGGAAFGGAAPGPSADAPGLPGIFPGVGGNGGSFGNSGGNGASGIVIVEY